MISLDEFLEEKYKNEEVGFIKFDLEGAGYQAIMGSLKTIAKYRPILSIAIYHSPIEFFKIIK